MSDLKKQTISGTKVAGGGESEIISKDTPYERQLLLCVYTDRLLKAETNFMVFTNLHRLNICKLQNQLIKFEAGMWESESASDEVMLELEGTLID